MGTAVIAIRDQFRPRDFRQSLKRPKTVNKLFAGFFGSLEAVNEYVRNQKRRSLRRTPAHLI
jgi:hypothetical protein